MTDFNRSSTLSVRRSSGNSTGSSAGPTLTAARSAPARTAPAHKPSDTAQTANRERPLESAALLQGRSHVSILHNGETYQLRATRLGKLILTK
ncbi:hemin uptake protein HemP [Paraburkholderia acidipaludis]|uniref:hemin uptake protein HemP n=1 Tax=Paraburkholderia acidipaludis TaxID=660537 RepID=UPI000480191C|nr:hemin uptake protein HemP [Paraburkholderia acidipaludis]